MNRLFPSTSTHIYLKRNLLYFRLAVPSDLRPVLGRSELRYSLRTSYLIPARHRANRLALVAKDFFHRLRNGDPHMSQLTEDDIQALLHRYLKEELEEDELLRARRRGERTRELNAMGFDVELDMLEQALSEEDYSRYTPHVKGFLAECGVDFDPESDAYKRLCLVSRS